GHSANRSVIEQVEQVGGRKRKKRTLTWIGELIEDYKQVDGQPLQEKNPKWLQDDYVKFIRWGEWRIAHTGEGILAFITNHAYLDNPTFRGMRAHLLRTFDRLYVLNLHGNARRKEAAPDGTPDENVFDIQQGVAILIAVKRRPAPDASEPRVLYADVWGRVRCNSQGGVNYASVAACRSTVVVHRRRFRGVDAFRCAVGGSGAAPAALGEPLPRGAFGASASKVSKFLGAQREPLSRCVGAGRRVPAGACSHSKRTQ
ncbi:MAG: hypothetical protein P3X24_007305, partial [bacterium]|nr:hypothetical protein [bacterium]